MKQKNSWGLSTLYYIMIGVMVAQTLISFFYDMRVFAIMLAFTLIVIGMAIYRIVNMQRYLRKLMTGIRDNLDSSGSETLSGFTFPIMVSSEEGEILWYNDAFHDLILGGDDVFGRSINEVISTEDEQILKDSKQADVKFRDRIFSVFESKSHIDGISQRIFYFIDETRLKKTAEAYILSRPVVAIVAIDNLDEVTKNARDSEKASISSAIEIEIENWSAPTSGVICKLSNDRFMLVLDEKDIHTLISNRFEVLDRVRSINFGDRGTPTLSIGVGRGGASLQECEDMARQALDMALGRGGDQAAVKGKNNEYQFFGGVSKAVEKRTKVRARVIASALKELIEASDNVLIMGHRYADLDCFGASYALWSVVRSMGKDAKIIMDKDKSLALQLLTRIEAAGITDAVSSGKDVMNLIDRKTLLIVVDTHRAGFVDNPEVYNACKTVVVIDHHRKAVDHIDNAVIFFHETFASSACEMVAELLQYIAERSVGRLEAEALLSGIMLDTRNYVLHTGVRTFEASAFLRNCGADPVEVKRLFSGTMLSYTQRAEVVASAEIYGDCAIAIHTGTGESARIVSSQAADELLTISGVNGSFVLFRNGGEINISSRSLGYINVQLIMESLGGGGHRTMSACQLKDVNYDKAKQILINAIEEYKNTISRPTVLSDV